MISITRNLSGINAAGYAGDVVLPITEDDIGVLPHVSGNLRAFADASRTQELPIDVVHCNEPWTSLAGNNYAVLRAYTFPSAYRDAPSGRTVWTWLQGYSRLMAQYRDDGDGRWSPPAMVGWANFDSTVRGTKEPGLTSRYGDVHNNSAVVCTSDGQWIVVGGVHRDALGIWTSPNAVTWTEQAALDRFVSYPSLTKVGNDVLLLFRDGDYGGIGSDTPLAGSFRGDGTGLFQTIFGLTLDDDSWPRHPDGGGNSIRHYPMWTAVDGDKVFVTFALHQDESTGAAPVRSHVFCAVIKCDLDVDGLVASWRWQDVAGNNLTANPQQGLSYTDVDNPLVMLVGRTGDASAIVNLPVNTAYIAAQIESTFALDDAGNPHVPIAVAQTAQTSYDDVGGYNFYHIKWTGAAWAAELIVPAGSTSMVFPTYVKATAADDVDVVATVLPIDWQWSTDIRLVRFSYDGATWTQADITPPGMINLRWGQQNSKATVDGIHPLSPAELINPEGDPELFVTTNCGQYGNFQKFGGGFPHWHLRPDGSLIGNGRALAYVRASVVDDAVTVYVTTGPGAERVAPHHPLGRHAVWQGYDDMYHYGATPFAASIVTAPHNQIPNAAGYGSRKRHLISAGLTGTEGLPAGGFAETRELGSFPSLYCGINSDAVGDGDLPPGWLDLYDAARVATASYTESQPVTPVTAPFALLLVGQVDAVGTAHRVGVVQSVESLTTTDAVAVLIEPGPGDAVTVTARATDAAGTTTTATATRPGLAGLHAVAAVFSATGMTLVADGSAEAEIAYTSAPDFTALVRRVSQESAGLRYNGYLVQERVGDFAADRLVLETGLYR